ncbi:hypothetical protein F5Y19DRAFT_471220 [Xylariaceae sp. FL1651]|nr:hypothetical protein F5Y19DRAFT_471220 [Xylariaceae sp. FL1651]
MSMTSNSTSGSRPTSRHYDTGFPDSFAARTTSLRHPDAILDPSFAISAEHVDPAKTLHRSRKSLLRKHRRTISHGTIPNGDLDHNELLKSTTMLSTTDSAVDIAEPESNNMNADIGRPSKDSMESSSRAQGPERTSPVSPGFQYTADGREPSREEHRKSNIFRKWRNKD